MRINPILVGALSPVLLAACAGNFESAADAIAFTGVSVIDVRSGAITEGLTIIVRDDRIDYVGNTPPAEAIEAATVYDYAGHYVIPGLWDMHVHIRNGPDSDLAAENALWLRQYLGFGVTAVRDAGGDLPEDVLSWRNEIERGERIGPRIFTALQKLDGPTGGWKGSIRLRSMDDVVPAIDTLQQSGADYIKLYDGSLEGDLYLAAIAEAERRGLKTAGHMPLTVMFEDAIAAGLDSVEHDLYLAKAAAGEEAALAAEIAGKIANEESFSFYGTLARLHESSNSVKLDRIFGAMIERGAALTPTLHTGHILDTMTDVSIYDDDPQLAQVPPGIQATFQLRAQRLVSRSAETVERDIAVMTTNRSFVKAAADRGVIVLAGSDTGAVNSYIYPGDSLHRELAELVEAGLTPLQALQGATVRAAEWLDESGDFGTVEAGKVADLLVLEGNPLADIRNSRSIVAVVQAGQYLDADMLAELRTLPR